MAKLTGQQIKARRMKQGRPGPKLADVSDLAGLTPEQQIKAAAPEAIEMIIAIMRQPGRNAQAQLSAARELLAYGVEKPATKIAGDSKGDPIRMIVNAAGLVDPNA